ncbi:MAG: hypothetical protein WC699_14560 [Bacteroidales bacterium]|jgi:hypothetical protein
MNLNKIGFLLAVLMFFGGSYCFSQSNPTGQAERIAAIEKRIAESADEFISLTLEEYELLLSQRVVTIEGFEVMTTIAGGIQIGYGFPDDPQFYKTNIQTIFPKIPNISEGEVFIFLDSVKGSNGLDYLDRQSGTEIKGDGSYEEDDFTQLTLDNRGMDSIPYWFGSRYVHLRDPADGETIRTMDALGDEVLLSSVSGKVVMQLPVNITGLALTKGDIGIEKSFAGGKITLKEIEDDHISFLFSGESKDLYSWTAYDDSKAILDIDEVTSTDGLFRLSADQPKSLKVFHAEIVRKEYPFAFVQKEEPEPEPLLEGIDAARFSAAMFFQTQLLQPTNAAPVYLDKNDPIFLSIKGRVFTDLRQSAKYMDPESAESKLVETQTEALSEKKKNQLLELNGQILTDYTVQTLFDTSTFIQVYLSFNEMDELKIPEQWELRVQNLGGDKYIAEFWEDSHIVHPEAKNEIGETERYYKMMALLYTLEKDSSLIFHSPFQPVIDFLK